ncbi:MAG: phosphonopyruvate decarboxylase [Clostridium sp.]
MINPKIFLEELIKNEIEFYCGVPDSLLKDFCAYVKDEVSKDKNVIAANEGNAIGIATGYYLSTNKIPLVYMQNSGIGNTVNPILSLQDKLVYSIPTLLMIGWRGEPGVHDEPQHIKQGLITIELLETLKIKYEIIDKNTTDIEICEIIKTSREYMSNEKEPFAIVVKKGTFNEYKLKKISNSTYDLTREEVIEELIKIVDKKSIIVSTTGMASRELFEIREKYNHPHNNDFLTVGSMGHASQIALGIAKFKEERQVYCIDGDGSFLMHMGGAAIIGESAPKNYKHIVINNGAHDSVGGQDTVAFNIDFKKLGESLGYKKVICCTNRENLIDDLVKLNSSTGPVLIEIRVKKGARGNLGRPTMTPIENKEQLMKNLLKDGEA